MDSFRDRAIAVCPTVPLTINNVHSLALLDTGSQVSPVSKEFYNRRLRPVCRIQNGPTMFRMSAANGTDIPYLDFIVADVRLQNQTIKDAIIFVVKKIALSSKPILLGVTVLQHLSRFRSIRQDPQNESSGFARAGRFTPPIPAGSSLVVEVTGPQTPSKNLLFEPSHNLPPG